MMRTGITEKPTPTPERRRQEQRREAVEGRLEVEDGGSPRPSWIEPRIVIAPTQNSSDAVTKPSTSVRPFSPGSSEALLGTGASQGIRYDRSCKTSPNRSSQYSIRSASPGERTDR